METQTKSCLLPLKKRADASFSSSTKRDRDNEYMQDHYGPRFCNNLPRQNSNPQKTYVPHLITLSAGKKNPFKKNWGKCFFQATYQQQLHALLTVIVFPPRPYSILLLMSMRVMSIRSTALHFKFPRRNSLLFFVLCPTLWYFCTTRPLSCWV